MALLANSSGRRGTSCGAFFACLVALAVRLSHLGRASLWYDETVSAYLAAQPVRDALLHTSLDIHPPGYYLALHFWTLAAGHSEYALAFFSLLFGVLLVALTYALACRLIGRQAALLSAWLAALSAYSIWYSQEVRMYTLGACIAVLFIMATIPVLERGNIGHVIVWAGIGALGLYTLHYFVFVLAFLSLLWLIQAFRSKHLIWHWLLGHSVLILLYLPWLPTAVHQAIEPPVPAWRSHTPLLTMLRDGTLALFGGEALPTQVWPLAIIALAIALIAPFLTAKHSISAWLLAGGFATPWLVIVTISLAVPLFHPRYLFPFAPMFWLALASSAHLVNPRARVTVAALLLAFIAANSWAQWRAWYDHRYQSDDLRAAIAQLAKEWCPGDAVLINAGYTYTAFSYYWRSEVQWLGRLTSYSGEVAQSGPVVLLSGSLDGTPSLGWGQPQADFYKTTLAETTTVLLRVLDANQRLWVLRLYDTVTDPTGALRSWLANNYLQTEDYLVPGPSYARLQAYVPRLYRLPCQSPLLWEQAIAMCAQVGPQAARGAVPVYLYTTTAVGVVNLSDFHYTLRVTAQDGTAAAQRDGILGGSALTSQEVPSGQVVRQPIAIPLPAAIPPGQYLLLLGIYTIHDGQIENLTATSSSANIGAEPVLLVPIGRVSVGR
ncbi:MAG: glycosyltransferase family 39 protein [Anaerolineae bacterium]